MHYWTLSLTNGYPCNKQYQELGSCLPFVFATCVRCAFVSCLRFAAVAPAFWLASRVYLCTSASDPCIRPQPTPWRRFFLSPCARGHLSARPCRLQRRRRGRDCLC